MDFTEIKTRLEIYERSRRRMGEGPDITQEALDAILALEAENERLKEQRDGLGKTMLAVLEKDDAAAIWRSSPISYEWKVRIRAQVRDAMEAESGGEE